MKNGKNTLFIIIALAILTIVANFIRINIANSTSEQGKTAHDQGNYDLAISAYTCANKLIFWDKEKKADNLFWRGRTYYYKQNFAKALSDFTEIIELQQDYYPYYTWLARTYYKMGNSELALANYDKSINLNELEGSVDWNTYLERADVYVVIGNNDRAIEEYNRAIAAIDATIAINLEIHTYNPELGLDNNEELINRRIEAVEKINTLITFEWPVRGRISSGFGIASGNTSCYGDGFHDGIDIDAPIGTPIWASRPGRVESVGYDDVFGNFVVIRHTSGYKTLYGLMESYEVRSGEYAYPNTIIGYVGKTGRTTTSKLHFTIYKDGSSLNPRLFLAY